MVGGRVGKGVFVKFIAVGDGGVSVGVGTVKPTQPVNRDNVHPISKMVRSMVMCFVRSIMDANLVIFELLLGSVWRWAV